MSPIPAGSSPIGPPGPPEEPWVPGTPYLTLTPLKDLGAVRLVITFVSADVVITRVDANGLGTVRLLTGQEPIDGLLVLTDYEPALAGGIRYDVTDPGGRRSASTTLDTAGQGPRLVVPVLPQLRAAPRLVDLSDMRTTQHTVHDVVGRDDPIVTLGRTGLRRGRMRFVFDTEAEALTSRDLYGVGEVVLLRTPNLASTDIYHVATDTAVDRQDRRWFLEVSYLEVARPTGPLIGAAGWTYDDVAAVGTYAEVRQTYPTYTVLLIGPTP